jgi:hypothetical protein
VFVRLYIIMVSTVCGERLGFPMALCKNFEARTVGLSKCYYEKRRTIQ